MMAAAKPDESGRPPDAQTDADGSPPGSESAGGSSSDPTIVSPDMRAPPVRRERPIPAVAGYEVLGELGRGGMGVVYKARQVRLNRPCVLKMILAGAHAGPEDTIRFLSEAEAVARLQHPNVVQIYHIGEADGLPYFELEYVDGGSLDRRLDGNPWPAQRAASLIEGLAAGVAEAHRFGIVHRDLKPGNILLSAHGTPKITDFGLAKSMNDNSGLTRTNSIMGSPGYMSPEQAGGRTKEVGPLADVYALGAILYELLTGRPPFRGTTVLETLEQVRWAEPVPPSRLVPGVPRDLETIALKCLQKEQGKRYGSSAALAEDLRRFRAGMPILARRSTAFERAWRWSKRNPLVAGAVASAAMALLAMAVLAVRYADSQARYARRQSEAASKISQLARDLDVERGELKLSLRESNRRLAALNLERGRFDCEHGSIGPGLLQMVESLRVATEADDPAWQHAARANLSAWRRHYPRLESVYSHGSAVYAVAVNPYGKTVLTGGGTTARIWDAETGQPVGEALTHPNQIRAVAFSPDGKVIVTGSMDWSARFWDAQTGQPVGQPLKHPGAVLAVALSPDGKTLLTGCSDHTARLWDARTGLPVGQPLQHRLAVFAVAFSRDGKTLVTGSMDYSARLWDTQTGRPIGPPLLHENWVHAVSISPDGKTIVTCSEDQTARLWDAATGRAIGQPLRHQGRVFAAAFSPDGKTFLTGGEDKTARLWDSATARPVGRLFEHQEIVRAVAFSPDGRSIVTGSEDRTARRWEVGTGTVIGQPLDPPGYVAAVAYSPTGKTFVTGSEDNTARVWDVATGQPLGSPLPHEDRVLAVAFSPDGGAILTGGADQTARLWDTAAGRSIGAPLRHQGRVLTVAFSRDGKTVLTASADGTAVLWDRSTGKPLGEPLKHEGPVNAVAFSPDGILMGTGSDDRTARVWDAASGRPIGQPLEHEARVHAVEFGSGGKTILTASDGSTARAWNATNGQPIGGPLEHQGRILATACSPDGKIFATASEDKTARLWDAATGQPIGAPLRHQNWVFDVAFSPDSETVLTGCLDSTARLWDARTGEPIGAPMAGHRYAVETVAFGPRGKTLLTKSQDGTMRLWDVDELPGDLAQLTAWVSVTTGLELNDDGSIQVLDTSVWHDRREKLERLGAQPSAGGRLQDPILFGLEPTARAHALVERGRDREAEAAFDEVVARRPLNRSAWLERGSFYAGRSQPDKAAADFARALDFVAQDRFWDSPRSQMIMDLARWEDAFTRLLELRPRDDHLWIGRGRYRALCGRWEEAASDYARGIASAAPHTEEWYEHACLRRLIEDREGLRSFLLKITQRAGDSRDPQVRYVLARSCNLATEPVVDTEQMIRWAEGAVAADRNAWHLHVLGTAHYRAGHFDQAIKFLEESSAGGWAEEGKAQNRLVLAMAHHRLGDTARARALLDEVIGWWDTVAGDEAGGPVPLSAAGWMSLNIFRREAEAFIAERSDATRR
jgi:WD40 repeat protein/tetratricopeptide (TPR) repeat protein/predicted Ser/Thr protein kinase